MLLGQEIVSGAPQVSELASGPLLKHSSHGVKLDSRLTNKEQMHFTI